MKVLREAALISVAGTGGKHFAKATKVARSHRAKIRVEAAGLGAGVVEEVP